MNLRCCRVVPWTQNFSGCCNKSHKIKCSLQHRCKKLVHILEIRSLNGLGFTGLTSRCHVAVLSSDTLRKDPSVLLPGFEMFPICFMAAILHFGFCCAMWHVGSLFLTRVRHIPALEAQNVNHRDDLGSQGHSHIQLQQC